MGLTVFSSFYFLRLVVPFQFNPLVLQYYISARQKPVKLWKIDVNCASLKDEKLEIDYEKNSLLDSIV